MSSFACIGRCRLKPSLVQNLAITSWQTYRARKVKTTASPCIDVAFVHDYLIFVNLQKKGRTGARDIFARAGAHVSGNGFLAPTGSPLSFGQAVVVALVKFVVLA